MKTKYYVIKVQGNYVADIDYNYSDTQACVKATPKLELAKLMNQEMRVRWITGLCMQLQIDTDTLESESVMVESTVVDESETKTFAVRFANGAYLKELVPNGVHCTKNTLPDYQQLDHADLNGKQATETIVKLLKLMADTDILPDELRGDFTIVPVKRNFTDVVKI